ncbi:alkaline-phosphatase-like protein [Pelagophyceae sp. CCMP2097]|nr:alkaline-phosphatase-like protein [Pelagophyceae sp. CCMP2097]
MPCRALAGALVLAAAVAAAEVGPVRSVLLITADDLRPEVGPYGCSRIQTPNIDALAREGFTFTRAYAQIALCAPSRNSFLSGRRPDATKAWQFRDHFREEGVGDGWTALPEAFRKAGFLTFGAGKVYHPGLPPNWDWPKSWSFDTSAEWLYPSEPRCPLNTSWCALEDEREVFEDRQTSSKALELLQSVGDGHFFLAVGFRKPHLLWRFPQRILDEHYIASQAPLALRRVAPISAPDVAFHMPFAELSGLVDFQDCGGAAAMSPSFAYPDECQSKWRRAYAAATTFMDEQVGFVLGALPAAEETVVVFLSDHGWHLGDQGEWEKFTNYEAATRVPLIVRAPWLDKDWLGASPAGTQPFRRIDALVQLLDLFPTLAALAGVDVSYTAEESVPLQGRDLSPLLRGADVPGGVALSQFPRCCGGAEYDPDHVANASAPLWYLNDCNDVPRTKFTHMGYSVRTSRWRYTEWRQWDGLLLAATEDIVAVELYDHLGDQGLCEGEQAAFDYETENLAATAPPSLLAELHETLASAFNLAK